MKFQRPQIVLCSLFFAQLLFVSYMHGKQKLDKNGNVEKYNLRTSIIGTTITIFLLYMGGFFG